jgi:hypothetical protein
MLVYNLFLYNLYFNYMLAVNIIKHLQHIIKVIYYK